METRQQRRQPAGRPTGGQFAETTKTASGLSLGAGQDDAPSAEQMLDELVRRRFAHAATPNGRAESAHAITEQQLRADAERGRLGGDSAAFHTWYDAPESKKLLRLSTDTGTSSWADI